MAQCKTIPNSCEGIVLRCNINWWKKLKWFFLRSQGTCIDTERWLSAILVCLISVGVGRSSALGHSFVLSNKGLSIILCQTTQLRHSFLCWTFNLFLIFFLITGWWLSTKPCPTHDGSTQNYAQLLMVECITMSYSWWFNAKLWQTPSGTWV